jgi:LysM repeat protein
VAATVFFMSPSAQASNSSGNVKFDYVTVSAGDTLWSIAQENVSSGNDARDYMYELATLNNLESADLTPGQRIALPNN